MSREQRQGNEESRPPSLAATIEETAALFGPGDANRKAVETAMDVRIAVREGAIVVDTPGANGRAARSALSALLAQIRAGRDLTAHDVSRVLRQTQSAEGGQSSQTAENEIVIAHRGQPIVAKTAGQLGYVQKVQSHDLTFCTGPAGTGKTYLAMAMAVKELRSKAVGRIILTRPIVEAGEALGFLPGDIMDKVDPYLRPLHDALYDIIGAERFRRHFSRGTIEVIPLAYMRGRTFNHSFIVLDEAQNTTRGQMKMALTRLGFGSKMVVTGDVTQTDLPQQQISGLIHATGILKDVPGIAICELSRSDIVRHDLVQQIVSAYGDGELESEKTASED